MNIPDLSGSFDDIQLLDLTDHTAFEVFPHDYDIPSGEFCDELNGYINYEIPMSLTEKFRVRSHISNEEQDVIIDWGDGNVTKLLDIIPTQANSSLYTYIYDVQHTYTESKKFIIRIFGKKYNSIIGSNISSDPDGTYNLISRILDYDLPIASHLTNFSSFALSSPRLLYVNATNSNFPVQVVQCPSAFRNCKNLISVKGLNNCSNLIECNSMFAFDSSLQTVDFILPNSITSKDALRSCFQSCNMLNRDIANFFPSNGFLGALNITNIFRNCSNLSGTIPSNILWQNKQIQWDTTNKNMFLGCSADIRSQAPTSWGGTNTNLETKLKILDENYYSAFQVYPTLETIPIGYCQVLSGNIAYEITARANQTLVLKTFIDNTEKDAADIVIDWGDNTFQTLSNAATVIDIEKNSDNETNYIFNHSYSEQKKYIIKIYGKDYFGLKTSYIKEGASTRTNSSQICRIFDNDLPIAPHVTDLSLMCYGANKLIKVNALNFNVNLSNAAEMFRDCRNLISIYFEKPELLSNNLSKFCYHCYILEYSNIPAPVTNGSCQGMYRVCRKLNCDISSLLNSKMYNVNNTSNILELFLNNSSLYGTVPADKLWNNKNITWLNTSSVFSGCSVEIRAQVPESWGGTASDDIIEKSLEEKYNELLARVEALENA